MRKRVHVQAASTEPNWLRVEELAEVLVSSEDANHPIEFALVPGADGQIAFLHIGSRALRRLPGRAS